MNGCIFTPLYHIPPKTQRCMDKMRIYLTHIFIWEYKKLSKQQCYIIFNFILQITSSVFFFFFIWCHYVWKLSPMNTSSSVLSDGQKLSRSQYRHSCDWCINWIYWMNLYRTTLHFCIPCYLTFSNEQMSRS